MELLLLLKPLLQPGLIFLLPLLLLFSFHCQRRQPNSNLPPGPQPFPIIGNLHNLRGLPHLSFHRLSKKYGPLIYLKIGQVPSILVSNADIASEIMKSQDSIFCSRIQLTTLKLFSYGGKDMAFAPFDDHWKRMKRLCNVEVFNLAKVRSFNTIRRDEINVLVNTITKACLRNEPVNLREILHGCTNNILFREVFGKRVSADGECQWSPLNTLLREIFCLLVEFEAENVFPSMGWIDELTGHRRKLRRTFKKMDLMFEEKIRDRVLMMMKSKGDKSSVHNDFLDILLQLHAAEEEDKHLTMNEIKAILMNMFIGGADTIATVIEWGMTRLMMNPAAMKKAQAEVRRVVGNKRKVDENDLQHLHFLKMVIKETLRLDPPGPVPLPRECMKDTVVAGYDIPVKAMVYVNLWSIGRDPKYWGDDGVEDFRPERFKNSTVNFKGAHLELIPFGAGRRICPGISLAMVGIELVCATLLNDFDWTLPNGMVCEDIDLTVNWSFITTKRVPLILVPSLHI